MSRTDQDKAREDYFNGPPASQQNVSPQKVIADMAEYIAHQLYHIRTALEQISEQMEEVDDERSSDEIHTLK
jgi:hypothetical protein